MCVGAHTAGANTTCTGCGEHIHEPNGEREYRRVVDTSATTCVSLLPWPVASPQKCNIDSDSAPSEVLVDAQAACNLKSSCVGVLDDSCKGSAFYLCDGHSSDNVTTSCTHMHPSRNAVPTPAPTTLAPTSSPTKPPHPCDDGTHGCTTGAGGVCIASGGSYECGCASGYLCTAGCTLKHSAHTCEQTAAPTPPPPTPAPTLRTTGSPTLVSVDLDGISRPAPDCPCVGNSTKGTPACFDDSNRKFVFSRCEKDCECLGCCTGSEGAKTCVGLSKGLCADPCAANTCDSGLGGVYHVGHRASVGRSVERASSARPDATKATTPATPASLSRPSPPPPQLRPLRQW